MAQTSAIETAARFGEIPFAAFTKDLITTTFDALVEANLDQMEAYVDMVNQLAVSLSSYINNTVDDVKFSEITDLITKLNLPTAADATALVTAMQAGYNDTHNLPPAPAPAATPLSSNVVTSIIQAAAPIVQDLLKLITKPPTDPAPGTIALTATQAPGAIQKEFIRGASTSLPNYNILYQSIAATIASNKYALLQNMVKTGLMRLVVSDGEIETRITFTTWDEHEDTEDTTNRDRDVQASGAISGFSVFRTLFSQRQTAQRSRTVTVNTAKQHHRDVSGSKVEIFGRVLIRFKTDYMPLNVAV